MAFRTAYPADMYGLTNHAGNDWREIGLFKNNVDPGKPVTMADFVECDFDGYGVISLNFPSLPFINGSSRAQINADSVTWVKTAGIVPNTVYGFFVRRADHTVTGYELFPTPVSMSVALTDTIYIQFSPTEDDS